ncbi:MAG: imidazole glycerol phosphate synthase subunit HisH, partial [Clostridia bacterium]|nr:imidazole glycerol phosphate synthase subunit HisH [Clostridia bacterium]
PHMGWNSLVFKKTSPLLAEIREGSYVYYVHSFCAAGCADAIDAVSDYGCEIVGAVSQKNVFGMQFHPEKSGEAGLKMLSSFCKLSKETLF